MFKISAVEPQDQVQKSVSGIADKTICNVMFLS